MSKRERPDHAAEARRREARYQRWCAEIAREARDWSSLARAESRALHDPKVRRDPVLAQMIRNFAAERDAALARRERDRAAQKRDAVLPAGATASDTGLAVEWTAPEVVEFFKRLHHDFNDHVAHLEEAGARAVLAKIRELQSHYPDLIKPSKIQPYAEQLDRLSRRCTAFRKQLDEVRGQAVSVARKGDEEATACALQRLSTIHALRPQLLSEAGLQQIRDDVFHASEEHEHGQAIHDLLVRERAVAAEITQLADIVHRFRDIARRAPHDSDAYRRAEAEYLQAVAEVRSRDTEWLTALTLSLDEFLEEWHEPTGEGQQQVDHFLESVRLGLVRVREEIQHIATELHPRQKNA